MKSIRSNPISDCPCRIFCSAFFRILKPILAVTVSFSVPSWTKAQTCENALKSEGVKYTSSFELKAGLDGRFRPTPGSLFDVLRANAPHQIDSLMKETQNRSIQDLLKFKGTIIADFHVLNLGDIELSNNTRKIGLIDIDDGGIKAPLIADVTRAIIGANVSGLNISLESAMTAYLSGLEGRRISKPKLVAEAEAVSAEDFLARQEEWMDKITSDKKFNPKSKVQRIELTSSEVQNLFSQVKGELEAALGEAKVVDYGYRPKDAGGSQGLPRFWYLIQNKQMPKNLEAIEFKFLGRPASDLSATQPDPILRVAELTKTFRPSEKTFGRFSVIKTSGGYFLMRTRLKNLIAPEITNELSSSERNDIAAYYLYLIQRLGANHATQLGSSPTELKTFSGLLNDSKKQADVLKWCSDYIEKIKELNSKK